MQYEIQSCFKFGTLKFKLLITLVTNENKLPGSNVFLQEMYSSRE
jgi:hypothetical protein